MRRRLVSFTVMLTSKWMILSFVISTSTRLLCDKESASDLLFDFVSGIFDDAHIGSGRQLHWLGVCQRLQWVGVGLLCLGVSRLRQLGQLTVQVIRRLQPIQHCSPSSTSTPSTIAAAAAAATGMTNYHNGPQQTTTNCTWSTGVRCHPLQFVALS